MIRLARSGLGLYFQGRVRVFAGRYIYKGWKGVVRVVKRGCKQKVSRACLFVFNGF